jgi:hypothetical protein
MIAISHLFSVRDAYRSLDRSIRVALDPDVRGLSCTPGQTAEHCARLLGTIRGFSDRYGWVRAVHAERIDGGCDEIRLALSGRYRSLAIREHCESARIWRLTMRLPSLP